MRIIAATLVAALITSPAIAKIKKPADPNARICRTDASTGSNISKMICHTAAQWQEIEFGFRRSKDPFEAVSSPVEPFIDHPGPGPHSH